MAITSLYQPHDERYAQSEVRWAELEDQIIDMRTDLLTHLAAGLAEFTRAAAVLDQLRAPGIYDAELAGGRDGRDAAARIDGTIRDARAAYAVLQMVFAGETPR